MIENRLKEKISVLKNKEERVQKYVNMCCRNKLNNTYLIFLDRLRNEERRYVTSRCDKIEKYRDIVLSRCENHTLKIKKRRSDTIEKGHEMKVNHMGRSIESIQEVVKRTCLVKEENLIMKFEDEFKNLWEEFRKNANEMYKQIELEREGGREDQE